MRAATLAWVAYAAGTGKYNTRLVILSQELPIKPARPTDEFRPQTSIYFLVVNLSSVLVVDRRSLVICCSSLLVFLRCCRVLLVYNLLQVFLCAVSGGASQVFGPFASWTSSRRHNGTTSSQPS